MTTFRSLAIGAAALLLPFAAVACGGDDDNNSGDRPSQEDLAELVRGVAGETAPDAFVDCLAKGLHDSDLPNGVLRKIAGGDDAEVDKDNEEKYTKIVEEIQSDCTDEAVGSASGT